MKKLIKSFFVVLTFGVLLSTTVYAAGTKEKYVEYKESSIYTQCYNYQSKENTAIIYIHGLGDSSSAAEFLYNSKNPYMTISYDNFSHGKSTMVSSNKINWDNQLGAINAIIEAYKLKKVYLVGQSIGADIAMMYAKEYPKKVRDIVLLDRAYYNYSELAKFNYTKDLSKIMGYDPSLQMGKDVFSKYIDLFFDNNITKTWNIKKKVMLIAANPDALKPDGVNPSMADMVSAAKQSPESFGLTAEEAAKLPNLTNENLNSICDLLKSKRDNFENVNHRFSVIKTNFVHNMQSDSYSKDAVEGYVLDFFNNSDKYDQYEEAS
ncbi:MAG: alpha/beta fold hydrolase [Clostridiaceae bacterium]